MVNEFRDSTVIPIDNKYKNIRIIDMNVLMNTINELSWKLFNNDFCDLDESKQEVVMTEFIINYN